MLSNFEEVFWGAAAFPESSLSLAKNILTFAVFNNFFNNSVADLGLAVSRTHGR